MTATITVATWNLEWKRPGTAACETMASRLAALEPDILCLTESYLDTPLPAGHTIAAEADYGYPLKDGRRKVMLWSRTPWDGIDPIGDQRLPTGRFISGRTETTLGPLTVIGVCIPWRDAHVSSGRRDRAPWEDHVAYLEGLATILQSTRGPAIVLGDFNQQLPRRSAPVRVHAALETALGECWTVYSRGSISPIGKNSIDHIAGTPELRATGIEGISNYDNGVRLSDQFGVAARLHALSPTGE